MKRKYLILILLSVTLITGCSNNISTKSSKSNHSDTFTKLEVAQQSGDNTENDDRQEQSLTVKNNEQNTEQNTEHNKNIQSNSEQIQNDTQQNTEQQTNTEKEDEEYKNYMSAIEDLPDYDSGYQVAIAEYPEQASPDNEKVNDKFGLKGKIKETSVINRISEIGESEEYSKVEVVDKPDKHAKEEQQYTYVVRFNDYNYYEITYFKGEGAVSYYDDTGYLATIYMEPTDGPIDPPEPEE